jgi:hypothetical protein
MTDTARTRPRDDAEAADAAWRAALARYIDLARQGANATRLREAAAAVHRAAVHKGKLARSPADATH